MAFNHIQKVKIAGTLTDIVCHKFQNQPYLLITQYQKIPNLYSVKNQTVLDGLASTNKVIAIQQKFGQHSDETEAAIRYLMSAMPKQNEILITLGLKKVDKPTLSELAEHLKKISLLQ